MAKKSKDDTADNEDVPILNIFFEESDRGCVLTGSAFLADDIEELLRYVFHMKSDLSENEVNSLLSEGGKPPLQSAWLKTEIACAFGLFPVNIRNALNSANTLRNNFAHKSGYRVLKISHLRSMLNHMRGMEKDIQRQVSFIKMCMEVAGEIGRFSRARLTYMACVLVLQDCCSRAIREPE